MTAKVDISHELAAQFRLDGLVAFVPGGYGGIGEAICWGLARSGAVAVIVGRSAQKSNALATAIQDAGLHAEAIVADAESIESLRSAVDRARDKHGRLDLLINCVGIQREELLADVSEEKFDEIYRVNLKAAMFVSQACARHQVAGGRGGAQVHLLSVRAQLGMRARGYSAYCATKGALVMLIKQHASELAPHGIRVNGVAPTVVATEMGRHWLDNEVTRRYLLERIPMGRVAEPKDIVGPVLFLCTPAASFVTGQVLYVDGGITASQ
jgi:NAD(P)-dependent dehydrogenase (short-subunit alcohol dehydrogenase family)